MSNFTINVVSQGENSNQNGRDPGAAGDARQQWRYHGLKHWHYQPTTNNKILNSATRKYRDLLHLFSEYRQFITFNFNYTGKCITDINFDFHCTEPPRIPPESKELLKIVFRKHFDKFINDLITISQQNGYQLMPYIYPPTTVQQYHNIMIFAKILMDLHKKWKSNDCAMAAKLEKFVNTEGPLQKYIFLRAVRTLVITQKLSSPDKDQKSYIDMLADDLSFLCTSEALKREVGYLLGMSRETGPKPDPYSPIDIKNVAQGAKPPYLLIVPPFSHCAGVCKYYAYVLQDWKELDDNYVIKNNDAAKSELRHELNDVKIPLEPDFDYINIFAQILKTENEDLDSYLPDQPDPLMDPLADNPKSANAEPNSDSLPAALSDPGVPAQMETSQSDDPSSDQNQKETVSAEANQGPSPLRRSPRKKSVSISSLKSIVIKKPSVKSGTARRKSGSISTKDAVGLMRAESEKHNEKEVTKSQESQNPDPLFSPQFSPIVSEDSGINEIVPNRQVKIEREDVEMASQSQESIITDVIDTSRTAANLNVVMPSEVPSTSYSVPPPAVTEVLPAENRSLNQSGGSQQNIDTSLTWETDTSTDNLPITPDDYLRNDIIKFKKSNLYTRTLELEFEAGKLTKQQRLCLLMFLYETDNLGILHDEFLWKVLCYHQFLGQSSTDCYENFLRDLKSQLMTQIKCIFLNSGVDPTVPKKIFDKLKKSLFL